jgi:hypothetical protein
MRRHLAGAVAGQMVCKCKNPNFVSIAAEPLGAACAPLVCTEAMPAAALRVLLLQLAAAMQLHGLAIDEEAVVAKLLPDLRRAKADRRG